MSRWPVTLAVALALLARVAVAQVSPSDVLGWQETRWGMTEEQVAAALRPLKLIPLDLQASKENRNSYIPYEGTVTVLGDSYTVRFFFSRETQRLGAVLLFTDKKSGQPPYGAPFPESRLLAPTRAKILQALTEKYGPPAAEEKRYDVNPDVIWKFPATTIRVSTLTSRMEGSPGSLFINYSQTAPPSEGKSRL